MARTSLRFRFDPGTNQYSYHPKLTNIELEGKKYNKVLVECSDQLSKYFEAIKSKKHQINRLDVVRISQAIGLPLKTTCEFLQDLGELPIGTWESKFATMTVKDLMELHLIVEEEFAGNYD